MNTRTVKQSVTINTIPHEVFEILMDEHRHALLTGAAAEINRKTGGLFRTNDGYSTGRTLELEQDKKIVQCWRAEDWPAGHYSTLTITLIPVGGKTRLYFVQTDVPDDRYEEIREGWFSYYWNPLKEMFEMHGDQRT